MKVGIKISFDNGIGLLKKSKAKYVEVWFRIDWVNRYQELFHFLQENNIQYGLHFWGTVRQKYFPNLVYYPDGIAEETAKLLRSAIEVAAKNGAYYLNFHPESFRLVKLNLDNQTNELVPNAEIDQEKGFESLLYHSKILDSYAKKCGVQIYIETVPFAVPANFSEGNKEQGRVNIVESMGVGAHYLEQLGKQGLSLCFDIGHSTGQYPNQTRNFIFNQLLIDAKKLAPFTKLIHVNTTIEPLNGTDSHHGILDEDFAKNVFPNKAQFLQLMKVFTDSNALIIPEPQREKMLENYQELCSLFP